MADKLPEGFDPEWYAATYPDVAMSGLNPREHYRRFGKLFGRKGARPPAKVAAKAKAPPEATPKSESQPPAGSTRSPTPQTKPVAQKAAAIVDRPEGFDPAAAMATPAPLKAGARSDGVFELGSWAPDAEAPPALLAYARLLNLQQLSDLRSVEREVSSGAAAFLTGGARIEAASLVDESTLRLRFAGGRQSAGWSFRAYQARPSTPAELVMLGRGVQFPALGPIIHDVGLLHPLLPLIFELSDVAGATIALALVPFPSLLPGGLHWAELKAGQVEPNPQDDFWALSDALLKEALSEGGRGERSITRLTAANMDPAVREWVSALFGQIVNSGDLRGGELVLPQDCVPTVSALVARRSFPATNEAISGAYLVADADSRRPRWSIALPAEDSDMSAVPTLRAGSAVTRVQVSPMPLAIALRPRAQAALPVPVQSAPSVAKVSLTVVVDTSEPVRVERLVRSIRDTVDGKIEWLVQMDDDARDIGEAMDRACEGQGWTQVSHGIGAVARGAAHETLLTISDRVSLQPAALVTMLDLLNRHETTASASCALLAEKIVKKDVVLQPASGGLFPTGVSFVGGPRLAFGEPNTFDALPDLDYPVAGNTLLFTVWRRCALAGLPAVPGAASPTMEDVRIGLDLMRAGFRNWCTTKAIARLEGPYVARDAIDPVGPGYLKLGNWEAILERVTVVRELFG